MHNKTKINSSEKGKAKITGELKERYIILYAQYIRLNYSYSSYNIECKWYFLWVDNGITVLLGKSYLCLPTSKLPEYY